MEEKTDFGRGYDAALTDINEWLYQLYEEWYRTKITTPEQALAFKDVMYEFKLRFLYQYRI